MDTANTISAIPEIPAPVSPVPPPPGLDRERVTYYAAEVALEFLERQSRILKLPIVELAERVQTRVLERYGNG